MASYYTVWHYQEQFGSTVFVTALQTVMGTYTSYISEPKTVSQDSTGHVVSVSGLAQIDTTSNAHSLQISLVSTGESLLTSFPRRMQKKQTDMSMDDTTGKVFLRIN